MTDYIVSLTGARSINFSRVWEVANSEPYLEGDFRKWREATPQEIYKHKERKLRMLLKGYKQ
jgi:hypothetical protein